MLFPASFKVSFIFVLISVTVDCESDSMEDISSFSAAVVSDSDLLNILDNLSLSSSKIRLVFSFIPAIFPITSFEISHEELLKFSINCSTLFFASSVSPPRNFVVSTKVEDRSFEASFSKLPIASFNSSTSFLNPKTILPSSGNILPPKCCNT